MTEPAISIKLTFDEVTELLEKSNHFRQRFTKLLFDQSGVKVALSPKEIALELVDQYGANKIGAIKELRNKVPGFGLADAKKVIEEAYTIKAGQ